MGVPTSLHGSPGLAGTVGGVSLWHGSPAGLS